MGDSTASDSTAPEFLELASADPSDIIDELAVRGWGERVADHSRPRQSG